MKNWTNIIWSQVFTFSEQHIVLRWCAWGSHTNFLRRQHCLIYFFKLMLHSCRFPRLGAGSWITSSEQLHQGMSFCGVCIFGFLWCSHAGLFTVTLSFISLFFCKMLQFTVVPCFRQGTLQLNMLSMTPIAVFLCTMSSPTSWLF